MPRQTVWVKCIQQALLIDTVTITESVAFITHGLAYYLESEQRAVDPEESEIFCASWNECFPYSSLITFFFLNRSSNY